MCAFFCVWEEGEAMKNRIFMKKSADEKKRYLAAVLMSASGGSLSNSMIRQILSKISIHKQYRVSVFHSRRAYRAALNRALDSDARLRLVPSQHRHGTETVIISPSGDPGCSCRRRTICIFLPNQNGKR
jgi:hypothetical protein